MKLCWWWVTGEALYLCLADGRCMVLTIPISACVKDLAIRTPAKNCGRGQKVRKRAYGRAEQWIQRALAIQIGQNGYFD